jgi:hypothetical protein
VGGLVGQPADNDLLFVVAKAGFTALQVFQYHSLFSEEMDSDAIGEE